ncbi:ATP-dependent helicase [Nocardioides panacisoli]|uniref:ATP-dependent helicase n=1 Tax=Nocardioides panacisoli TaxID=627624 RepID=UPI001C639CE7|nr:ATP-dependent DNA helicase [Nocardioides panacisoli]QYJ05737.1 ATP-dependent helicase [Nocardioides panacisoli]
MPATETTYTLAAPQVAAPAPTLDEWQQRVVDHPGGPLLVLAGPGTGKTTTMVEAIVERIEQRGASPDQVLALTFSRKAAEHLRDRVTARLGRTMATQLSSTFHSFAYALVRRHAPAELYEGPLRLLSAPEQDVVLRELLTDHPESVAWPDRFRRALGTRGFAHEVQSVLGRAREKGMDGHDLRALGEAHDLPEYVAAGLFLEQYLDSLDSQGAVDYADLIRRARIEAEAHQPELRAQYRHVFVDEYQDTDPGQVALLRALAGDGRDLVAVGDPHQSIYGFRGAEVRGILEFPTQFRRTDGAPADVVALRTTRRFGTNLLLASQRVAGRLGLPGTIPEQARTAFLQPRTAEGMPTGKVTVHTFDTERAEAEHLADLLRRAHLEDGIAWDDMAVLVRSGRASIGPLRRALGAAGVPVEVASDEVPLVRDPAVQPLLDALRAVVHLDTTDPADPDHLDAGRVEGLLTGPLGGLDAGDVRRLARQLRHRDKAASQTDGRSPRHSRDLLRGVLTEEGALVGLEGVEVDRADALVGLLWRARARFDTGASAEEVLWELWAGTDWPRRLRRNVEYGAGAARRAHRDLDALCALFDLAARAEERREHLGVTAFLETLVQQQIPADTLADQGVRGSAVRLLTAHRSKGLEWRLVAIAHVQAEGWPDLRRRTTLLQADRLGAGELVPPVTSRELLMEERRLFYVAATRARERLLVTAVRSPEDDGDQPSRFLAELVADPQQVTHTVGRPRRPLSLAGLVAELRRTVADPAADEGLREAAAQRLARLAGESAGGRRVAAAADPATWWGTRALSRSEVAVSDPEQPVAMSASKLEGIQGCPARWFLEREAGGAGPGHQAANLGTILHKLAEQVANDKAPADVDELMGHVERVWDRMEFRTPWARDREFARARAALERFLAWHARNDRALHATEVEFRTEITLEDGHRVRLHGFADRIEIDADGDVVVVDLKTGRSKAPKIEENLQLALYQHAVDEGALDERVGRPVASGGAELLQVGLVGAEDYVVQAQATQRDSGSAREDFRATLAGAVQRIREEDFPAMPGPHCRWCDFQPLCPAQSTGSVVSQ